MANSREHGTTGQIPAEQLLIERAALQALPPRYVNGRPRQDATIHRPLPTHWPVEPLQHPLSTYDALLEAV